MSENDEPIFPRSTEIDETKKQKLYQETRQKLEAAEKVFEGDNKFSIVCSVCGKSNNSDLSFCLECGQFLNSSETPIPVTPKTMYGPAPMIIDDKGSVLPRPAYGPPPISVLNYRIWLILGGLFFLVVLAIYFFVFR